MRQPKCLLVSSVNALFLCQCLTSNSLQVTAFIFALINLEINAVKQVWHKALMGMIGEMFCSFCPKSYR